MIRFLVTLPFLIAGLILVLPVLAIFIPVWTFCYLVDRADRFRVRREIPVSETLEFAPVIGWKPRANLKARYLDRIGDRCSVNTDEEGWPGEWSIEESDVVVFGDSFAFGYGARAEDAYYSNVREFRVKPVGAQGYSMVPEVLLMERYAFRLKGKLLVWFVCMENDLAENLNAYMSELGYTTPFLRQPPGGGEWEIFSEHVQEEKWCFGGRDPNLESRYASICTPCDYSDRVFSGARYLIQRAKRLCDAVEADLVVFSIPYKLQLNDEGLDRLKRHLRQKELFNPAHPDEQLSRICHSFGVPFYRGASYLTVNDYKSRDGHWTAGGNRKVARVIERIRDENRSRKDTLAAETPVLNDEPVEKLQNAEPSHMA